MVYKKQFDPECITLTQANIMFNTRFFWRQLVYWTTTFYYSAFEGIGNVEESFARLYNTPVRFTTMLQLVLGKPVSEQYLALLNDYTVILRQLVTAVIAGDTEGIDESMSRLAKNSINRSEFFSQVLPSLDKDVLRNMVDTFERYEIEEINAHVSGDYSRIIETYDNLINHTEMLADYFSKGLIDLLTTVPKSENNLPIALDVFKVQNQNKCITYQELDTILNIALIWIDLISWIRAWRVSIMAGVGDTSLLYDRMIQVTVNFGNYLKIISDNDEAADVFAMQLQEYLNLMGQLLEARGANNIEEVNRLYQLLLYTLDQSAETLSSILPDLDIEWENQFYRMNTNLINMGTAFFAGDYSLNTQIFDDLIDTAESLGFTFLEVLFENVALF